MQLQVNPCLQMPRRIGHTQRTDVLEEVREIRTVIASSSGICSASLQIVFCFLMVLSGPCGCANAPPHAAVRAKFQGEFLDSSVDLGVDRLVYFRNKGCQLQRCSAETWSAQPLLDVRQLRLCDSCCTHIAFLADAFGPHALRPFHGRFLQAMHLVKPTVFSFPRAPVRIDAPSTAICAHAAQHSSSKPCCCAGGRLDINNQSCNGRGGRLSGNVC